MGFTEDKFAENLALRNREFVQLRLETLGQVFLVPLRDTFALEVISLGG